MELSVEFDNTEQIMELADYTALLSEFMKISMVGTVTEDFLKSVYVLYS